MLPTSKRMCSGSGTWHSPTWVSGVQSAPRAGTLSEGLSAESLSHFSHTGPQQMTCDSKGHTGHAGHAGPHDG